jgi:hypothetical protein
LRQPSRTPDKFYHPEQLVNDSVYFSSILQQCLDFCLSFIEDGLFYFLNWNIDIGYWAWFLSTFILEEIERLFRYIPSMSLEPPDQYYNFIRKSQSVNIFEANKLQPF